MTSDNNTFLKGSVSFGDDDADGAGQVRLTQLEQLSQPAMENGQGITAPSSHAKSDDADYFGIPHESSSEAVSNGNDVAPVIKAKRREPLVYGSEPIRIDTDVMNSILIWAAENDVSDVTFRSGEGVWVKHHGMRHQVTRRALSTSEIGELVNTIYGANGTATLGSANDIDTSYAIKISRVSSLRFRVNATQFIYDGHNGNSVTIRIIKSLPPSLAEMDLDEKLLEPFQRKQGMCLVTGETGSGKSTLQAAIIRHLVEQEDANLSVLTYEAPIEYSHDEVMKPSSFVTQHEVPKNLRTFKECIRNAMRRDPDIIQIGESRDAETMEASIEASRTGHLMLTTLHSNGVSSTIRRAVAMFPEGERSSRAQDIIQSVNVILTQRLVPSLDGKRVPLREYLIFTEDIRDQLIDAPVESLPALVRNITRKHGQTLEMDARKKFDDGLIHEQEYKRIEALSRKMDDDSSFNMTGIHYEENQHFGMNIGELIDDGKTGGVN